MAKRIMKDDVELIKTLAGKGRGGSRPKPPKAVVRSASLEAPRALADHKKAKRCLKTVAFPLDAERWALICVESIICVSVDRPRRNNSVNILSHTPRLAQRTKRL